VSPSESWLQLLEHPPKSLLPPSLLLTGFAYLAVALHWIGTWELCVKCAACRTTRATVSESVRADSRAFKRSRAGGAWVGPGYSNGSST